MITDEIREQLFALQDLNYKEFQSKLIPSVHPDSVIGVRTPELRKLAKELGRREDIRVFLGDLPHSFFDENQLHAFLISDIREYEKCIAQVNRFLPYVDNWATCDQMSPKVFQKHRAELLSEIENWIPAEETYTVRFGIGMLMRYYLEDAFDPAYPEMVAEIRSEEYYINMMIAWYFATALAKQYQTILPYLEEKRLDPRTHNKTIQKALESYRITSGQKDELKRLKI